MIRSGNIGSVRIAEKVGIENFNEFLQNIGIISDLEFDLEEINDQDSGNDFEKILKKNEPEFNSIMDYLESLEGSIFSRLTGSGSCIFSVFEKKEHANSAQKKFIQNYSNLWTHISENNLVNLF